MNPQGLSRALVIFLAGTAGSVAIGAAAFHAEAFSPGHPFFQCVSIGALMAGILALVRGGRIARGVTVALAFTVFQLGLAWSSTLYRAITILLWSLIICAGILIIAVIYDLLARRGFRIGKFVLMGPLLGGVYIAATPVTVLLGISPISPDNSMTMILLNTFLGIVIGDGVGLGAEVAELLMDARTRETGKDAVS